MTVCACCWYPCVGYRPPSWPLVLLSPLPPSSSSLPPLSPSCLSLMLSPSLFSPLCVLVLSGPRASLSPWSSIPPSCASMCVPVYPSLPVWSSCIPSSVSPLWYTCMPVLASLPPSLSCVCLLLSLPCVCPLFPLCPCVFVYTCVCVSSSMRVCLSPCVVCIRCSRVFVCSL